MDLPTLCRELRAAGYRSCVFSDWAGSDFGKVDFGFDEKRVAPEAWSLKVWIAQAACRAHPLLVALGDNMLGRALLPELRGMPVNPDPQSVTRDAVGALERFAESGQPFFMIVFYSETHMPYATRYPYYRRFADPDYRGPHKVNVYMPDPRVVASGAFDPAAGFDREQLRALYDGAVLSFDDQVGEVLAALRQLNLWDDTLVVVTSDHGEDLLEVPMQYGHGHGFAGDDYDSRIPLVISDPAMRGRGAARVIGEPASSIDLMPTLLERVGLGVPATCEGRSLLDLVRGRRAEGDRAVFAEAGVLLDGGRTLPDRQGLLLYPPLMEMFQVTDLASGQVGLDPACWDLLIRARHRMIRTRQWKLVYMPTADGGARYALYDVVRDPECLRDVSVEQGEVAARLKAALWQWMEADPLRRREGEQLVSGVQAAPLAGLSGTCP
jgi:arylsulfatase A-like enzyme